MYDRVPLKTPSKVVTLSPVQRRDRTVDKTGSPAPTLACSPADHSLGRFKLSLGSSVWCHCKVGAEVGERLPIVQQLAALKIYQVLST